MNKRLELVMSFDTLVDLGSHHTLERYPLKESYPSVTNSKKGI
jgi:hypothetical protein